MIEQVVGDLEGEPDIASIGSQVGAGFFRHAAENCAHLHRGAEQRAG